MIQAKCLQFYEFCINFRAKMIGWGRMQMPALQVRELPDQVYRKLQEQAAKEHRSLAQQAIVTLAKGLGLIESPKRRRADLLKSLMERPVMTKSDDLISPVDLVRQDRDR